MTPDQAPSQGTPNWADCATTDLAAAEAFYGAVFGWTARRMTGSDGSEYSIQHLAGKRVAGIYELDERMRATGVPPHWGTYLEVDDVDATLAAVVEAGGTFLGEPLEEPGVGRIAIVRDPVGAFVRIWHSEPPHGAEVFNSPGAVMWNELSTKEPGAAARFYERAFGLVAESMTEPVAYTTLNAGDRAVAGILEITPEMGDFPPSWEVYLSADDLDATLERVIGAGGSAVREPFQIPGVGRMAVIRDPQGAVFDVMSASMSSQ